MAEKDTYVKTGEFEDDQKSKQMKTRKWRRFQGSNQGKHMEMNIQRS